MGRKTNKQRREKQAVTAREKAAVARVEAQRAAQRRRATTVLSSVVVLAVVGAVIAYVAIHSTKSNTASGNRVAATASVVKDVTSVTPATLATVAGGGDTLLPKRVSDPPLTSGGKPQVLFIGAEFCPFCAAERWPLIQALSRFGTFKNLNEISSSSSDTDPNTPTFSFYKSSYTSKYVSFDSIENETRSKGSLENPNAAQTKLWLKYTGSPPNGPGYPFIDYGGSFVQVQQSFDPTILAGLTQAQIASQLDDPTSSIAKAIDGGANMTTATICTITKNQPASVCLVPAITNLQSQIGA